MWGQQSHKSKEAWKYENKGHQSKGVKNTPHQKTGPRSLWSFLALHWWSTSCMMSLGGTQNDLTEPFCSPKKCNHGRLKNGDQKSKEDLQGESFFRNIHELAKFWFHSPTSCVRVFPKHQRCLWEHQKEIPSHGETSQVTTKFAYISKPPRIVSFKCWITDTECVNSGWILESPSESQGKTHPDFLQHVTAEILLVFWDFGCKSRG